MTMTPQEMAQAATDPTAEAPAPPKVPAVEGITVAQANKQAQALRSAGRGSPVRQLRYLMNRLAREWEVAAGTCEGAEEDYTIELVGSLSPGMRMPCRNKRGNDDVGTVIRLMTRDGQTSIHVAPDDDNADVYLNFAVSYSPAVVVR